jgi:hypothetical protein
LEVVGIDGRIVLKMDVKKIGWVGVEWIDLAHERDKWRAVVNVVLNFTVPVKCGGNFVTS